jgi:hypothetical protein
MSLSPRANMSVFNTMDRMTLFQRKLQLWSNNVEHKNFEIFPTLSAFWKTLKVSWRNQFSLTSSIIWMAYNATTSHLLQMMCHVQKSVFGCGKQDSMSVEITHVWYTLPLIWCWNKNLIGYCKLNSGAVCSKNIHKWLYLQCLNVFPLQ